MKFSTFTSVATLFAGAIAVPHTAAKRADITALTSLVANLKTEVTNTVSEADKVTSLVLKATAGDLSLVTSITAELITLNNTIASVDTILSSLGVASLVSTVDNVGQEATGLVKSAASVANTIVGGLLNTSGGLTQGVVNTVGNVVGGVALVAIDAVTALDELVIATGVTAEVGKLVASVSDVLSSITVAVKAGKLSASTSTVTSAISATVSTVDLDAELQDLITTIAYILSGIVGKL